MNLLQMSFSGAAFITAVVLIRAVAINKLPKKTFLVLWELVILRLLIPFSIPSMFSVYTLVTHSISSTTLPEVGTDYNIPTMQGLFVTTQGVEQPPADISSSVSMWFIVWCAGIILIALFFVISYLRCLIEFRTALPVHHHYVEKWLAKRPSKRPILVKQSDRISAPLTYGIFRPVILMPKKMDWKNEKQLQYVLSHEYVHIYRYDTVTKLIVTLALCIHWFNPFVWVMYILFNRDIELACDESVIRQFGEKSKSAYSLMLINMEATKSGLLPFCNNFSKNAIEERITAVMKINMDLLEWANESYERMERINIDIGQQDFWNRTDIEEMLSMTKDDIVSKLKEIAAEYSNDKITIIIREDSVSFEKMDERSGEFD